MPVNDKLGIVYLVTNRANGKRYIGVTKNGLRVRKNQHKHSALRGKRTECRYFHAAIRKHGIEVFDWQILAVCQTFQAALTEEVRLIAEIRPEYNLTTGGQGVAGRTVSEAQRRHHSEVMSGRPLHPNSRAALASGRGPKSPELRAKLSALKKGRQFSEEHRKNLSLALARHFDAKRLSQQDAAHAD